MTDTLTVTSVNTRQTKLQDLRIEKGVQDRGEKYYQSDVANAIGVDRSTYAGWENNDKRKIPNIYLRKIAKFLGTTPDFIDPDNASISQSVSKNRFYGTADIKQTAGGNYRERYLEKLEENEELKTENETLQNMVERLQDEINDLRKKLD